MNILLTGCEGFVGTHLRDELEAHGHTVIGSDKGDHDLAEPWQVRHLLDEVLARENGPVVAFGTGPFYPGGPNVDYRGPVPYAQLPELLWQFETFVFLPSTLEPFGRVVAEAHAAGCEVWTNRNVGAMEWLGTPGLRNAAEDFWKLVCNG